jgi:hypothetical protein
MAKRVTQRRLFEYIIVYFSVSSCVWRIIEYLLEDRLRDVGLDRFEVAD